MYNSLSNFVPEQINLPCGESMSVRLLNVNDAAELGKYFNALSEETKKRFGPHNLDQEEADRICGSINHNEILRLVAVADNNSIAAYFLLKTGCLESDSKRYAQCHILLDGGDATFAPSIGDAYQDRKLGTIMIDYIFKAAKLLGRKRIVLWGGVQASNQRAFHYYQKHGFLKVGEYEYNGLNYDMMRFV